MSVGKEMPKVTASAGDIRGVCAPAAQPAATKHARVTAIFESRNPNLMKNSPHQIWKLREDLSTILTLGDSIFVPTIFGRPQISACAV
jgi:hypothetical protein